MRIKDLIFAIALLTLSAFSWEHPLKMSFSKLIINSDGYVELETRIFWDDLTEQMQNLYYLQQPDFSDITTNGTQALQRYLSNHFYFEQDGQKIKLWIKAITFSENRLALVVNMSSTDLLDASKEVFLVNTLLCDASPKQKNDIKYLEEHYLLSISNPKVKIHFD